MAESFDSVGIDSLHQKIQQGTYGNIDELLLIKNGKIIIEKSYGNDYEQLSKGKTGVLGCGYQTCKDSSAIDFYNYYHPKYHPYYENTDLHTLQSVTKSVAATVIGLAIDKGHIGSVQDPIFDYLQAYQSLEIDASLRTATIEDVLTMRLGVEWNENTSPLDSLNNVIQLESSDDWVAYTLTQPLDTLPGQKWVYNSGASHLMSAIIEKATGEPMEVYAEKHLFQPLGIKNFFWKKTSRGLADSEGGLYLSAKDLAKIGLLYLHEGVWNGKQVLSQEWVVQSTSKQAIDIFQNGGQEGYGYQWWVAPSEIETFIGIGFGNQFLIVVPQFELIGVVNGWNIFDEDARYIFGDFLNLLHHSNS